METLVNSLVASYLQGPWCATATAHVDTARHDARLLDRRGDAARPGEKLQRDANGAPADEVVRSWRALLLFPDVLPFPGEPDVEGRASLTRCLRAAAEGDNPPRSTSPAASRMARTSAGFARPVRPGRRARSAFGSSSVYLHHWHHLAGSRGRACRGRTTSPSHEQGLADLDVLETATDDALCKALGGDERRIRAVRIALRRRPYDGGLDRLPLYDANDAAS